MNRPALILASASPRRRRMLSQAGFRFSVQVPPGDENGDYPHLDPKELVLTQARAKALAVAGRAAGRAVVLSADTVVVLEGQILGKPSGPEEAGRMLAALSGRTHEVLSGFCLVKGGEVVEEEAVATGVEFRSLSRAEIEAYVAGGSPLDKAGGYGIQDLGGGLARIVRGSYTNVVGLPLAQVIEALARVGVYPKGMNP